MASYSYLLTRLKQGERLSRTFVDGQKAVRVMRKTTIRRHESGDESIVIRFWNTDIGRLYPDDVYEILSDHNSITTMRRHREYGSYGLSSQLVGGMLPFEAGMLHHTGEESILHEYSRCVKVTMLACDAWEKHSPTTLVGATLGAACIATRELSSVRLPKRLTPAVFGSCVLALERSSVA